MPRPIVTYGYFGKFPGRGDFVSAGFPRSVVSAMDAWATKGMAELRERSGEAFDELYGAAPLWRFAAGAGVFGEMAILGVLAGGVDAVGRPFPFFSGVANLPDLDPEVMLASATSWYADVEDATVALFGGTLELESFIQSYDKNVFSVRVPDRLSSRILFETSGTQCEAPRRLGEGCSLDERLFCQLFLSTDQGKG